MDLSEGGKAFQEGYDFYVRPNKKNSTLTEHQPVKCKYIKQSFSHSIKCTYNETFEIQVSHCADVSYMIC